MHECQIISSMHIWSVYAGEVFMYKHPIRVTNQSVTHECTTNSRMSSWLIYAWMLNWYCTNERLIGICLKAPSGHAWVLRCFMHEHPNNLCLAAIFYAWVPNHYAHECSMNLSLRTQVPFRTPQAPCTGAPTWFPPEHPVGCLWHISAALDAVVPVPRELI